MSADSRSLAAACALVCAVTDGDQEAVDHVLRAPVAELRLMAVVLARMVPDDALLPSVTGQNTLLDAIVAASARICRVSVADVYASIKAADVVRARHVACAVATNLGYSSPRIGKYLGRDHSTVLHAVKKVNADESLRTIAAVVTAQVEMGMLSEETA